MAVQPRRRFVEEEEEVRFGSELNADCETFSLFNIETYKVNPIMLAKSRPMNTQVKKKRETKAQHTLAGNTNNGVRVPSHLEQLDDLLDVVILVLQGHRRGLSQRRAKPEGLPDRGRLEVDVLLLHVARFPLERVAPGVPVDRDFARDNAHRDTVGEDVEEGGFAGSGGSLDINLIRTLYAS